MKKNKQTLVIIILLILLGLAGAYILLGPNGYSTSQTGRDFFDDVLEIQSTLSYYVGASYSDAFGVYTKEEILSGFTSDGEKIKDNEDNLLPPLVSAEDTLDYKNDKKAYKLDIENVKTVLKLDIGNYEGITFYVVEGDILKVKIDEKPDWWNSNYDNMIIK